MPVIDVMRVWNPAILTGAFTFTYRLPVRWILLLAFIIIQVLAIALLAAFYLLRLLSA